jgi:hypothetical protein
MPILSDRADTDNGNPMTPCTVASSAQPGVCDH